MMVMETVYPIKVPSVGFPLVLVLGAIISQLEGIHVLTSAHENLSYIISHLRMPKSSLEKLPDVSPSHNPDVTEVWRDMWRFWLFANAACFILKLKHG